MTNEMNRKRLGNAVMDALHLFANLMTPDFGKYTHVDVLCRYLVNKYKAEMIYCNY